MAHRYGVAIVVATTPDGRPNRIVWRDVSHEVTEILSIWHLRDRWWADCEQWETPLTATTSIGVPMQAGGQERPVIAASDQPDASDARAAGASDGAMAASASDRLYYRVLCADGFLCEVYYDRVRACWVLDRVPD